jgi:hypothetical protein
VPRAGLGRSRLVYGEEKDLFHFTGGRFAFSREHADWALLRKRGRLREYELPVIAARRPANIG